MEGKRSFIKGAALLTIAALFVKILSAVYRVPFQNIVGDTGFYIYQQVYPFYGIAAGLAGAGFPVVISRLVAGADEKTKRTQIQTAFFMISIMGIISFFFLFFSANWIAAAMGDEQLEPLIQLSAFFFLAMPYITVWRGAFQGEEEMIPTASSQIAEQSTRVACILLFSLYIVFSGRSLYEAGFGAVAGSLLGMIASIIVMWLFSRKKKMFIPFQVDRNVMKIILIRGSAICFSSLTLVLLQLADSFQLYIGLVTSGIPDDAAKEWKGIYDRGQPLLQLGVVAAVSIALTVVPLLSKAAKEKDNPEVSLYSQMALRISFSLGLAASSGLVSLMAPLNMMLFETKDGSGVLAIFAVSIFFYSIMSTMSAIFQGIGNDWIPAAGTAIALVFKWTMNALFIPIYGLYGASISTVVSLLAGVLFLSVMLKKHQKEPLFTGKFIFKTSMVSIVMAGVIFFAVRLLLPEEAGRVMNGVIAIGGTLFGACLFFFFMVKWEVLNEDELRILPFGSKIIHWTAKRNMRM
ncbi:putative polysaccharide biosynthesis protein [Domibacillus epiphyticus]|uniref:Polysaccharide biosynthesis protein C-terminal domain-containing protein n=1 Tax=Domibacillus epiphyticus TaxID=1714355 RepID=A0A1V2A751_9BACI|nr:polysaccharide biosynthesis protein [Domibacillus epiphyticus]OMP66833.1 hypothetical protein BTO28_10140 [Domibacillus epiphyticus]